MGSPNQWLGNPFGVVGQGPGIMNHAAVLQHPISLPRSLILELLPQDLIHKGNLYQFWNLEVPLDRRGHVPDLQSHFVFGLELASSSIAHFSVDSLTTFLALWVDILCIHHYPLS